SWPFAVHRRAQIGQHFLRRQHERRGALWNGRVLLIRRYKIEDGILRAVSFETDYASFLAWREWDFPDRNVFHIFPSAVLQSVDGAYIVGKMGPSTAAPGTLHFPSGSLDLSDVTAEGTIDIEGSLRRELLEETGIEIATLEAEPVWSLVQDRCYLALMKRLKGRQKANALRSTILRHIARDPHPEFSAIEIVRGLEDCNSTMPDFIKAFFKPAFSSHSTT